MSIDFHPTAPRPVEETEPLRDSRETNPMFNDQKMKLGLFGTNCSYGLVMSHAPSTYEVTWAHTKEIAQRADALGFEALVPIARWKGFGGTTNFNGNCFETYTWAAGLAEATENIAIFATSHLPTVHPIVAAKMATTIDRISGGRFGLNLVMGWVTPELAMFGEQRQQEDRYAFGQEWIDYVLQLWGEKGSFEHHGTYFDGINLESYPKPVQAPRPVLINAGNSKSGIDFSARNVDINFASLDTLENMKDYTTTIKDKARDRVRAPAVDDDLRARGGPRHREGGQGGLPAGRRHGRLRRGRERHQHRPVGVGRFVRARPEFQERFVAGWGGYPLVGTPEQVVEGLGQLNEAGMDGMIMGLLDYNEEMKYFGEKVMPLMVQAGLRH